MTHLSLLVAGYDQDQAWVNLAFTCAIIAVILGTLFALLLRISKQNLIADNIRVNTIPICIWKFSEAEWEEYSKNFLLHKNSKGSAEIRVTVFDIWVIDGNGKRRYQLNAGNLALTDCRVSSKGIKVRTRSVSNRGKNAPHYRVGDFYLPVPPGKEADAVKIVDAWKKAMADNADVIAEVTPPDISTGLFGENDF